MSWATWMGVFQPGSMELLKEGGMGHSRARRLTTRLSRVINECRTDIARERNERARAVPGALVCGRAQSIQHSAFSIQRGARSEVPGARCALGSYVSSEGRLLARAPSSLP